MRIRPATAADTDAISLLLGRAYPTLMAASYDARVLSAALPAMIHANPDLIASGTYYVAELDGRIMGCGGYTFAEPGTGKVEEGVAHLRHFATDPDVAGTGVGSALVRHCAQQAQEAGAIRLHAAASLNAEPFYRRLGLVTLRRLETCAGPNVPIASMEMEAMLPLPLT